MRTARGGQYDNKQCHVIIVISEFVIMRDDRMQSGLEVKCTCTYFTAITLTVTLAYGSHVTYSVTCTGVFFRIRSLGQ